MKSDVLVALGGALGSVARDKFSGWIVHQTVAWRFPLGTFAVNVLGCLVIGLLALWAGFSTIPSPLHKSSAGPSAAEPPSDPSHGRAGVSRLPGPS